MNFCFQRKKKKTLKSNPLLESAQEERRKLIAEGDKLYMKGDKEGGRKLWEKANLILAEAILVDTEKKLE